MQSFWNQRNRVILLSAVFISILVYHYSASAGPSNGFYISNAIIPADEILQGGPPKDGIPALSDPELINPTAASYLKDDDRIIGVSMEGVSRAYPIAILNWHEIVNDEINGRRFAVTYCPLCGTGVAFYSEINGEETDFGVSGLLYNSDVLLYDRNSESLWSQIMGQAIAGKYVGTKLEAFPVSHTTWRDWLEKNPQTLVMSTRTGFHRDYQRNPYQGYEKSRQLYFQVNNRAPDTYHPKEKVYGVEFDGVFKAYPFSELEKNKQPRFSDKVNGVDIVVSWDSKNQTVSLSHENGEAIAGIQGFWFAWFAFHPDTLVFKSS